ncbi:MAG: hypothetical protein F4Z02_08090 [Acidimicrobiia bacterium]|nr:hypothetical protein [Acidimicrobiia bacterium]MYG72974.1 hypothetical protein [Acidimicrobiia bacterium]
MSDENIELGETWPNWIQAQYDSQASQVFRILRNIVVIDVERAKDVFPFVFPSRVESKPESFDVHWAEGWVGFKLTGNYILVGTQYENQEELKSHALIPEWDVRIRTLRLSIAGEPPGIGYAPWEISQKFLSPLFFPDPET